MLVDMPKPIEPAKYTELNMFVVPKKTQRYVNFGFDNNFTWIKSLKCKTNCF